MGRNPFFIRSVFVPVALRGERRNPKGRNPFFIRSVFVHGMAYGGAARLIVSQSLFHQVCVRSSLTSSGTSTHQRVAIPFSSGLCSFWCPRLLSAATPWVAIPFSSGLCSFEVVWQWCLVSGKVAIPFSSGLCSFSPPSQHS